MRQIGIPCLVSLPEGKPVSAVVHELADGNFSLDSLRLDQSVLRQHPRLLDEEHSGAISEAISLMGSILYNSQVSANEPNHTISRILPS